MSEKDLVAAGGFVVLFLMMLVRVPIGVAMGLVGVGGFGLTVGWSPALNLLATSPLRTVTDFNLTLIPLILYLIF